MFLKRKECKVMKPLVSICCITYNQEKYIANTLESFLMQRTYFPFEILIHDDASTDRTADIIREYQKMYPTIIKPILQTENKMSQGIEIDYVYNFKRALGKYVAYCEGDDYWTDPDKLQKQVDFMEEHAYVSAYIHADKTINESGEKVIGERRAFPEDHFLEVEEAIYLDGKFAQNSMLFRNEHIQKNRIPDWYFDAPVSDYPLLLFFALHGKIYYKNEVMSAYRRAALNSWTRTVYLDSEKRKKHYEELRRTLQEFDRDTEYQYTKAVEKQILHDEFILLLTNKRLRKIKSPVYRDLYNALPLTQKVRLHVSYYLPFTLTLNDFLKETGKLYIFKPKETFPVSEFSISLETDTKNMGVELI